MSIFKKIFILFIFSFILMSIIGFWIDNINEKRLNNLISDKYANISFEILDNINSPSKLNEIALKYSLKDINSNTIETNKILYEENITFGFVKIIQEAFGNEFIIHIKYLDEELAYKTKNEESLRDKYILNILIWLDIVALTIMFLFILKTILPLKKINEQISKFADGDFSSRVNINSNDEIGTLAKTFNNMASKIEDLIKTREELLRDIGHELRTPIAKGKFAIEKIDDFSKKELMKKIFNDLEVLTNELIELEKLNSSKLEISNFSAEKLIIESLQKLHLEDENKINLDIIDNFKINGDLYYLCIALKNLIDNALKYSVKFPIIIISKNNNISVVSYGAKLSKDIEYYLQAFTQELSQRNGFGLGLSIVKKIIDKHKFRISYSYENNKNIFTLNLQDSVKKL